MANALTKTVQLKFPAFSGGGRDIAFLACPPDFDAKGPFTIVLFFHGFDRPLDKQVADHALANQVVESLRNCVLICPRTAVLRPPPPPPPPGSEINPGAFGNPDRFSGFLEELPGHIKTLVGDDTLDINALATRAASARMIIATFSAGHRVASTVMSHPKVRDRLAALAFFDSLYRSNAYFQNPQAVLKTGALVGVHRAVYDQLGADEANNHKTLRDKLVALGVTPSSSIEAVPQLDPGAAVLESVDIDDHFQIVANGSRLAKVIARVKEAVGAEPVGVA